MAALGELQRLAVFSCVVERRSFSEAARFLGVTKSTVSKQVAELEASLGLRLLDRTTRKVAPTEAGRRLYEQGGDVLDRARAATQTVRAMADEPQGVLRVAAPSAFGRQYVGPLIARFLARWPRVQAELVFADRPPDLVEARIDVAFRLDVVPSSSFTKRLLGRSRRVICGSPEYLRRRGTPQHPDDLLVHDCLVVGTAGRPSWRLVSDTAAVEVPVNARVRADDGEALHGPMLAGTGLGYPPELAVADALRRGDLVTVMPEWSRATLPLSLVCPSKRQRDPKVRRFMELAWAELHDRSPWSA